MTPTRPSRFLSVPAILLLAILWPAVATAADSAAELANEATRLAREGDFDQAIVQLKEAVKLEPDDARYHFQLASMLAAVGRFEEAGPVFSKVVARDPENSAARRGEITALLLMGRYVDARQRLEEGLTALPRDGALAHTLARVLATAPLEQVRNGQMALALAAKVFEVKKNFDTGETVAMAYAELGRFEDAVEFQRGLIEQAEELDDSSRVESLRKRLLAYLDSQAWRAETPSEIAMATEPPSGPPTP